MGLEFRAKTEDVLGRHLFKYHVHEPALSSFLVRELRLESGDVVFDIGANIGWYSLLLQRLASPGVDIYSFEPDQLNFNLLSENLNRNNAIAVTPIRRAVAELVHHPFCNLV